MGQVRNKIRRLTGSKNARLIASNFLWLTLLQIAGYIFPLFTVPYLANVIGVTKYGEIAFAMAIMVYFQTLVDYGFIFSAVRDISRCRENNEKVSDIYSRVMWSRWLILGASFLLLTFLIICVPKFNRMAPVLYASFLMVIGHAMFPDWLFQAMEKMKYITIFNITIKLIFTIAVFAFIRTADNYILQPLFASLGYIISGAASMWIIHQWGITLKRPPLSHIWLSLKSNFDLFINQLVPNLYNSLSVLLLGFIHGDAANGVFDAANRFNHAGSSFFSIISRIFYPFLARRIDKHGLFFRINIFSSSVIAISLFFIAPPLIRNYFPETFDGSITVLRIISISLIFLAIDNVFGTNYLILQGYEKECRKITTISSLIGFIIAIPCVWYLSYIGVALTITFSRGLIGFWCWSKARSIIKENEQRIHKN